MFSQFKATLGLQDTDQFIRVWTWDQTPLCLKWLSKHGGDEDWAAVVPPKCGDRSPAWADSGTNFGVCDVYETPLGEGWVLLIGAHS